MGCLPPTSHSINIPCMLQMGWKWNGILPIWGLKTPPLVIWQVPSRLPSCNSFHSYKRFCLFDLMKVCQQNFKSSTHRTETLLPSLLLYYYILVHRETYFYPATSYILSRGLRMKTAFTIRGHHAISISTIFI